MLRVTIKNILLNSKLGEMILNIYKSYKVKIVARNPQKVANKIYKSIMNKDINWDNPKDLIEKIYWLQLYTDTSLWTLCADKYKMREYVKSKGCYDLLPQLYGCWDNANDIDFSTLPNQFVLKSNNGCGQVLIVKDKTKLDINNTINTLNKWMRSKYGYIDAQIHYTKIKPCIIAEEYLKNENNPNETSLIDYKIWCFHGKPEFILVAYDRGKDNNGYYLSAYDLEWNNISDIALNKNSKHHNGQTIKKPLCLSEMIKYASILSKDFPEVRVDFYETNGKLNIGELTFTSGHGSYNNKFYEYLGSKIDLSKVNKLGKINRPNISNY